MYSSVSSPLPLAKSLFFFDFKTAFLQHSYRPDVVRCCLGENRPQATRLCGVAVGVGVGVTVGVGVGVAMGVAVGVGLNGGVGRGCGVGRGLGVALGVGVGPGAYSSALATGKIASETPSDQEGAPLGLTGEEAFSPPPVSPPATRTMPLGSKVAV
jgi:hypothetical protein